MLRGAQQTLAQYRPRLAIELHSNDLAAQVLSMLDGHGYACFGHAKDGEALVYRRLTAQDAPQLEANDHIAASTDAADLEQPLENFR